MLTAYTWNRKCNSIFNRFIYIICLSCREDSKHWGWPLSRPANSNSWLPPKIGAPHFPIPMHHDAPIMFIQWKSKEEYWAPWLSKEIKCKMFIEDSGTTVLCTRSRCTICTGWWGVQILNFHSWVFSPNKSWISKCESPSPPSEISKVWPFNPNVSMHLFHLNTGPEFGTIESEWNSCMGKLMAPSLNKLPASLLEFGIATRQCNHALPATSSH